MAIEYFFLVFISVLLDSPGADQALSLNPVDYQNMRWRLPVGFN